MEKKIIVLFLIISVSLFAQDRAFFFPDQLNFKPYAANILEPRMGFMFELDKNYLRLDIGNSQDIVNIHINKLENLSLGADFFTYTLLRSQKNFKFPVEAVDYLFGINIAYKKIFNDNYYGFRLRISHISSHLSDGRFELSSYVWRDSLNPFVYSREFAELSFSYNIDNLRFYVGGSYIFHLLPRSISPLESFVGCEYYYRISSESFYFPYVAYMLKTSGYDSKTYVTHSFNAGIKIGYLQGGGLSVYFAYYKGKNFHGPLYRYDKNYLSFGFNFDLK